ncbi:hypothetical protein BC940DRAFT_354536 [Gongronella butleri]|nr:hypothetical protein BC940DRAFT_354536 [Gongronella butleri]
MTEVVPPSLTMGPTQTDHLWKIIEKQRAIIQELQTELSKVTGERDQLLKQAGGQPSPPAGNSDQVAHYSQLALPKDPKKEKVVLSVSTSTPTSGMRSPFDMMFEPSEPMDLSLKAGNGPTLTSSPPAVAADHDQHKLLASPLDVQDLFHDDTQSVSATMAAAMDEKDLMLYTKYHEAVRRKNGPITPLASSYAPIKDGSYAVQSSLPPPPSRHGPISPKNDGDASNGSHLPMAPPSEPINMSAPPQTAPPRTPRTPRANTMIVPSVPTIDEMPTNNSEHSFTMQRFMDDDEVPDPTVHASMPPTARRPSDEDNKSAYFANYGSVTSPSAMPTTPRSTLVDIIIRVISANMTTNEKGKVIFSFTVRVGKKSPVQADGMEPLWSAEKSFVDFVNLDQLIKTKQPAVGPQLLRLPDKSLFVSRAPAKVDERRLMVEQYLQRVLSLPLNDMSDVCDFLSTNVIESHNNGAPPKRKFGYLTKRGKNWGGWKLRFFVLDGPTLNYFESKGGEYLGSIQLPRAQIGRQVNNSTGEDAYRHAFLILEPKKSAPQGVARHVLCADSDFERDQWVEALKQYIVDDDMSRVPPMTPGAPSNDYREQLNKYLRRSKSDASSLKTKKNMHQRQRSSLDEADIKAMQQQEDDDKKKKPFWGKKMFQPNENNNGAQQTPTTPGAPMNPLLGLQGALSADQAAAIMNSTNPLGFPEQPPLLERGPKQVFGVPLDEAIQVSRIAPQYELPAIVYRCIEYLEAKNAAQEEGIYRLSGSAAKIKKLKERFNQEGDIQLLDSDEYKHEVHAIAGLLKMWFRELPGSVLTMELLNDFLQVADLEDRQFRTEELGRLVSLLPLSNYTLLRTLSAHLIRIVQNSGVNKMTLRNIGIVFSATLGIPAAIFNQFLSEFDYVFFTKVDAAGNQIPPPNASNPGEAMPAQQSEVPQPATSPAAPTPTMVIPPIIDRRGRNNRNSALYMGNAPKSIVGLERHGQGYTAIIDEEDEDNTLGLDQEELQSLQQLAREQDEQHERVSAYQQHAQASRPHTSASHHHHADVDYASHAPENHAAASSTFTLSESPPSLQPQQQDMMQTASPQQLSPGYPPTTSPAQLSPGYPPSASPNQLSPHHSQHSHHSRGRSPSPSPNRAYSDSQSQSRNPSPAPRSFTASPAATEYTAMVIEPSF